MLARGALLFVAAYVLTTAAMLKLVPLPEIPLLRYVVFVVPALASIMVVASWRELGAPWPAMPWPARRQLGEARSSDLPRRWDPTPP